MSQVYQIVTDNIIKMLDEGIVPWRKPWTSRGSGIARNAWNKPYRGINVFLLAARRMQSGFKSNFWVTFNQAKKEGGTVRTGEKGQLVIFWKMGKPIERWDEDKQRTIISRPFILRYFTVFNLDQIEGMKLTKAMQKEQEPVAEAIDAVTGNLDDAEAIWTSYLAQDGAPSFTEGGNAAFYVPSEDRITLPERSQFNVAGEYFATAFHEATHSTGHADRLKRREHGEVRHFGDNMYAAEELVAEFGSAMLCAEAGIDNTIENSVAYIQNWKAKLQANPKLVVEAAGKAQKAADFILGVKWGESEDESE